MEFRMLHDWEIMAIATLQDEKKVQLDLAGPSSENSAMKLSFSGVVRFYASGMMLQNVILDTLTFTSSDESEYFSFCKKVLNLKGSEFEPDSQLKVFYIEPSVGVEIACLCEGITIDV